MFEPKYVLYILLKAKEAGYSGIENKKLIELVIGADLEEINQADFDKFKYHMDELWTAGLFTFYEENSYNNWGYDSSDDGISICVQKVVLTPLGNIVLDELKKPKGLDKLITGIKKAGAIGAAESIKQGISFLIG